MPFELEIKFKSSHEFRFSSKEFYNRFNARKQER